MSFKIHKSSFEVPKHDLRWLVTLVHRVIPTTGCLVKLQVFLCRRSSHARKKTKRIGGYLKETDLKSEAKWWGSDFVRFAFVFVFGFFGLAKHISETTTNTLMSQNEGGAGSGKALVGLSDSIIQDVQMHYPDGPSLWRAIGRAVNTFSTSRLPLRWRLHCPFIVRCVDEVRMRETSR